MNIITKPFDFDENTHWIITRQHLHPNENILIVNNFFLI